ncbi:hypothetical protein PLICRDRAFT_34189 [Plicaturopsis crispa FD-325 SS-3]|nr:hypothetical protein PLICRDRAFT_34189 [Plicaturopsis crispa FD-325 SS-3]
MHLPPAVKQLLTLRNPNSLPSPPLSQLHGVFTRTLNDAKLKKAETGWLVLTTCTLLTANRPSALGHLYRFATRSDPADAASRGGVAEAVRKAALMREAAMKSTIFIGVPRAILSLAALREAYEDDVKASLRTVVEPRRAATPDNIEAVIERGKALWANIYEPHAVKLHDKLGSYHPDFIAFIIFSYGAVLSPLPGGYGEQGNLSRTLGSVVGTACLRAEGGVGPQLISHVFGLLKARAVENQSDEDMWLASDEGTEWVIRTVDNILDALGSEGDGQARVKL